MAVKKKVGVQIVLFSDQAVLAPHSGTVKIQLCGNTLVGLCFKSEILRGISAFGLNTPCHCLVTDRVFLYSLLLVYLL